MFALAFLAPHWAGWRMPSRRYLLSLAALVISVGVSAPFRFWTSDPSTINLVRSALLLREVAAPGDTIAVFAAGIVPYYSELRAVDLLGKNDAVIAHQPIQPHRLGSGHNKFDFDYSLGQQRPDLVMPLAYPNKSPITPRSSERLRMIGLAGRTPFILTMFSPRNMPARWRS